jgi:hypothetical protein
VSSHQDVLIAVSLGRPHEPAGLVRVRRTETLGEAFDAKRGRWPVLVDFEVDAVARAERSGGYQRVAELAAGMISAPERRQRQVLLADVTTAGRAALDPMRARRLRPIPLEIVERVGSAPVERRAYTVGRAELASGLAVVIAERRLAVADIAGADLLAEQLALATGAKPKPDASDAELVDALMLALWWGERRLSNRLEQPRPPRQEISTRMPTFDEAMKRQSTR